MLALELLEQGHHHLVQPELPEDDSLDAPRRSARERERGEHNNSARQAANELESRAVVHDARKMTCDARWPQCVKTAPESAPGQRG